MEEGVPARVVRAEDAGLGLALLRDRPEDDVDASSLAAAVRFVVRKVE